MHNQVEYSLLNIKQKFMENYDTLKIFLIFLSYVEKKVTKYFYKQPLLPGMEVYL